MLVWMKVFLAKWNKTCETKSVFACLFATVGAGGEKADFLRIGMWRSQEKFSFIECKFHKANPFECECECKFNHMLTCLW